MDDSFEVQATELGKYIDIRYIPRELQTQVSIFLVDRKFSLVAELKDDVKQSVYEAISFATYSNSASTVSSYVSIFERLWRQTEMYKNSQDKLHSTQDELANMKDYLNEVLTEVVNMKKPLES